ncbi:protein tesmin/TSO1-like CXC 3 isoform X2 [Corylus avellana]|uniref:protein tesmin/TSO1-like CXC 3 isoform X2 n=1 Tax=Corylus avellana TaxID=13451 RepID=UPI00286B85DB|nr:protein tesmin/TSO1-like CXC 3 isoform X2 [Corylus avellana]
MDTPEKNHVTATSEFEDSPVFNYISNLSPIGPVESIRTNCAFNSLTCASPPSVFASPQICIHKETRFSFRRHHFLDPSKPDSSHSGNENNASEGVSAAVQSSVCSEREITIEPPDENSDLVIELPKTLRYDCSSPDGDVVRSDAITTETMPDLVLASFDELLMDDSKGKHHSFKREINLRRICSIEQNEEARSWVTLVSDAADLLFVDLSNNEEHFEGQDHKSVDPGTMSFISTVLQLPQDNANDLGRTESVGAITSCKPCEIGETATQSREIGDLKETDPASAFPSSTVLDKLIVSDSSDEVDHKGQKCMQARSKRHRSIRQRCLVFETAGACKNKPIFDCNSSSVSIQSDCKVASDEKQLVQVNARSDCSSSVVSGSGLHLNALSAASPNSVASRPNQNTLDKSLSPNTLISDLLPCDNEAQVTENAPQTSKSAVGEEFDHSSPKRKRLKSEDVGESKACKRCNCKRSKCLKLYCECFAAGLYCVEPCSCQDCFNKPIHENTVLETRRQIESRNPLAFAPKVIRRIDAILDTECETKTPASARHKSGCNCKKSSCLKKYCECFQSGVGCTISCRCNGCKNTFGQKDGAQETELKREESEACEKNALGVSLQIVKEDEKEHLHLPFKPSSKISRSLQTHNEDGKEHPDLPITSTSDISRPPIQLPFTFSGKRPLSYFASAKTSPRLCTRFEKPVGMIPADETNEAPDGASDVISVSPKSKRVSPPNREFGSTAWRHGRKVKLTLRSIPPFPSLTPPGKQ